ncbi:murein tripeptide amidase MpaA [Kribbella voronezhensis]|uniref:Zinc carboxypeptidase n=1 Tax=Kribbella voronezhensis TaxID=2512212 RepID=A0A4R7TEJ8_9ACTN|nr:M14 family zinc carboxypeptidase [Kribbella voronezhensis]TDU89817.1 murein tripeptide amidase MpaA [Kribbella voronezhensis]
MSHPARWHRLIPLAIAAVLAVGAGSQVQAAPPPDHKAQASANAELIQLLRVSTPTAADKQRLNTLDLDLAESAGKGFVDLVAYGNHDRRLLQLAGFRWTVIEDDLVGADKEREAADAAYAKAVENKAIKATLPSGRTAYRQLADYNNELAALATQYPTKVKQFTVKNTSLEGRTIRGIEVSHDVTTSNGKPVFLMVGLHHAREWPSGELTMEFAYDLLKNDGVDPRITNILEKARVIFVPVVNPDGFNLSRTLGYEMKRKNCRVTDGQIPTSGQCAQSANQSKGTDLNRNYSGFWGGPGASSSLTSETYRGASAFSEPESRNIQALVSANQVTTLITNHTYSNLVLREPGYAGAGNTPDEAIYKSLGDQMAAQNGYTSQFSYELYDTTGTTEDWSYYATGGLGFTFEHGANSFHPAFSNVVNYYYGSGSTAGKGNRAAFLLAAESTINPARHSIITGTGPAGAVLRLKKSFSTKTWNGTSLPDVLDTTMVVPAGGTYTWHTNPSTRPSVVQQGGTEAWTLTCERPTGQVLETRQVTVARGASVTANLTTCAAAF